MRIYYILPLIISVLIMFIFMYKMQGSDTELSSHIIGKKVTPFSLPAIYEGQANFTEKDLLNKYSLVNVFASWCVTCKVEHQYLMQLKNHNIIEVYGLNWNDDDAKARSWLDSSGNPYSKIGADKNGAVILDWGVVGTPETFLIGKDGTILYKHAGVLTSDVFEQEIKPLMK